MTRRKDGRWQECLKTEEMDSPKYFYSSEPNEKKARKDITAQIANFKIQQHQEKHNFFKLCEYAIAEKELTKEYNTYEMYKYAFKRIPEAFNIDIEDITAMMVKQMFDSLAKKQYSYSAIHQVKVLFGVVFDYAILHGLNIFNFMSAIKMPKDVKKKKIHSPDDEVIDFIRENVETTHFGFWPLFILATGTRRGEANAVQKCDINFKTDFIHIGESTEFRGNTPVIKKTKTDNGERDVPILDILREPLKKICENLDDTDYIFGGKEPLTKATIRYNFEKYKKACGYKFTSHQVRHAYAKLLYLANVDPKTAQGLLGHASIEITMDLYTDFDNSLKRQNEAATKVNEYLSNNRLSVN